MKRKILALLLAALMMLSLLPVGASAEADTVYTLTDSFVMGKTYLIVSVNSGSGVALTNTSDNSFGTTSVTVSDSKITASNLSKAEWEAKSTGTGDGLIGLYNGSNVLKINASGTPYINTLTTSYHAGGLGYTSGNHISYPYGSNPKDYYIGTEDGTFAASSSEPGLGEVYIFVKGESGGTVTPDDPDDPVTGATVSVTPSTSNPSEDATIAVGEKLTVKVTNGSSSSSYTYSVSMSKDGVASAATSSASIAAGATGEFSFTGLANGTVTITIQNSNSSYTRKATINLTVGTGGSDDPDDPDDPVTGDAVEVTPTTDNPTVSAKIAVGEKLTVKVTNGSSSNAYDYTASSGSTSVATVSPSSANIAAGKTAEFVVTGVKDGTVTITIQNNNSTATRTATINLTVGTNIDSGTCGDNLTWTLDREGILTISGLGGMYYYGSTSYSGISATSAPWGNHYSSIKSVVIENGVTSIGGYAFNGCSSLTSITIGNGVTSIGNYAFENCSSLKSVSIPDSVTSIGLWTFAGCSSLTGVTIPDSVKTIGGYAFSSCTSLESVTIPNSVTVIGGYAFSFCSNLISVVIPDSVTNIEYGAFLYCSALAEVKIGSSVMSIDDCVFMFCPNLCNIFVSNSNANYCSVDGVLYSKDMKTLVVCPSARSGLYTIPDSVTCIGNYAFHGCSNLTSVNIPNSVSSIGREAFSYCSSITNMVIPCSITTIQFGLFYGECINLSSVFIHASVTSIEYSAFSGCSSLCDVYYTGTQAQWNSISIGSDNSYLTNATIHYYYNHSHSYNPTITKPVSCTIDGEITYSCVCGDTYTDVIKASGHVFGTPEYSWNNSKCTAVRYCGNCTVNERETVTADYIKETNATCILSERGHYVAAFTNPAFTTQISESFDVGDPNGHKYVAETVPPTCTAKGYTIHSCENCEEFYVDSFTDAIGHNFSEEIVPPTCLTMGCTVHTCANCKLSYIDSYVNAIGHSYTDKVIVPTCTTEGYTIHTCENCDSSRIDSYVDAIGHKYSDEVKAPSCTSKGYTIHSCINCELSYVDSFTDCTAHSFGEWVMTVQPSCIQTGIETRKCTGCGFLEMHDTGVYGGHQLELQKAKPETCTQQGYTGDEVCLICENVIEEGESIAPHAHNYENSKCTECGAEKPDDEPVGFFQTIIKLFQTFFARIFALLNRR